MSMLLETSFSGRVVWAHSSQPLPLSTTENPRYSVLNKHEAA